ncbi:site-specific integrase [bacterium]|nr:site-specific integrase [bacterium]
MASIHTVGEGTKKRWVVYWREGGAQRNRRFKTPGEAKQHRSEVELQIDAAMTGKVALEPALATWCEDVLNTRAFRTYEKYLACANVFCGFIGGDAIVSRIQSSHIAEWRNHRLKTRQASTVSGDMKVIRAFFNFASLKDWCAGNPVSETKMPKVERKIQSWAPVSEVDRALELLREKDFQWYRFTLFAARAGMRTMEILNLKYQDIQDGNIVVNVTKSKEPRVIPAHAEILEHVGSGIGWIFPEVRPTATGHRSKKIGWLISNHLRDNGIDLTMKSFRHSFGSALVSKGVSLRVVADLMGHENVSTTQIYVHANERERRDAILRLTENVESRPALRQSGV